MFSGLEMSGGYLFAALAISSVGFALFVFGKKQLRVPQLVAGLALMALPMGIGDPLALVGSSAATLFGLWLAVRAGA